MDFSKAFDKVGHERLSCQTGRLWYNWQNKQLNQEFPYPTTSRLWYWRMREATVEMSPLAYHKDQYSFRDFSLCTSTTCQISYCQL